MDESSGARWGGMGTVPPGQGSPLPAEPPASGPARRAAWVWGAGAWFALRALVTLSALASSAWIRAGPTVPVPGYRPPQLSGAAELLAGVWLRADALWYLRVAALGYGPEHGSYAFYPLFPFLVRSARPLFGGSELIAALAVANAACLLGLVLIFRLVERLAGQPAARAAVVGLALFPTAFFLVAPYAEPLLVAAGTGALLAALRGRMAVAGLAGAAAALARPFGLLLAVPLAALGWRRRGGWMPPAATLGAAAAWTGWVGLATGDPLAAVRVQAVWQRSPRVPLATLVEGVGAWLQWRPTELGPYLLLDLAASVFAGALIAAAAVALRRAGAGRPAMLGVAAYAALVLLVPLSAPFGPRPLMSVPRFVLAMFPAFAGYALLPGRARAPLAALSAAGLAWASAVYVAARPLF